MLHDESLSSYSDIITFTQEEKELVEIVFERIGAISSVSYERLNNKLLDLERVAKSISKYPSIKASSILAGKKRDAKSLVSSLCDANTDSMLLSLPAKTILGKAYLVAKFHTFVAFAKVGEKLEIEEEFLERLKKAIFDIMFTIMAEDVYVSLLSSEGIVVEVKEEIAFALTDLWESRLDKNATQFSSILTAIWQARANIAPVFGTMMGTSEFFSFSSHVGLKWAHVISKKLVIKEVMWALEEFLFGISYEEIIFIREKLEKENIKAVSRDEVFNMLGRYDNYKASDARSFYASYARRRNNAEARKRLGVIGPKNILEDHCVRSMFEDASFLKT